MVVTSIWRHTQQVVSDAIAVNRMGQALHAEMIHSMDPHYRLWNHCVLRLALGRRSGMTTAALSYALTNLPLQSLYVAPGRSLSPEYRTWGPGWDEVSGIAVTARDNWGRAAREACRGRHFQGHPWPELVIVDHLVDPRDPCEREMRELVPMAEASSPEHPLTVLILQ